MTTTREKLEALGFRLTDEGLTRAHEAIQAIQARRVELTEVDHARHAAAVAKWRETHPGTARLNAEPVS